VHQIPEARPLPIAQSTPARHARPTAQFLRQHLPRDPASEHEEDAGETCAIRHARPSTVPSWWWNRKERFDEIPQRVGQ
jgi:hypothetical protein